MKEKQYAVRIDREFLKENYRMKYFYPIILKNNRLKPFELSNEITIRHITISEREEFFGLKKVGFIFSHKFPLGYIALHNFYRGKKNGRCPYKSLLQRGHFDGSSDIIASNYVLCIDCDKSPDALIDKINISFILHRPTSTGAYLGFRENETDVHFNYRMPIHGPFDYLYITRNDLRNVKKLFTLIEAKKEDDKFNLCAELYSRALQGGKLDFDLRFILLVTCLESLYLPDIEQELTFRLCLRIAKLLSKYGYGARKEIYKKTKDIYKARSILLHSGKVDKLSKEIFYDSTEIVRKSLILYLKDSSLFSKDGLDNIVLN